MSIGRSTRWRTAFLAAGILTLGSTAQPARATNLGNWASSPVRADSNSAYMNGTRVNLTIMPRDSAGIVGRSMILKGALRGADATQDWFLEVTGAHVPLGSSASAAAMAEGRQALAPLRFALERNRPNPYSSTSSMRFALPAATNVRMELFDLQGRRVRTLASGRMEAGWHSVTLDRRQERGASLPAGVYLCRLVAGRDRAERKVVVMP